MKMTKWFLMGALIASVAHAEGDKGNGGDAVVCRDANGKITSAELLDHYEGRELRRISPVFEGHLTDRQYFNLLADKLEAFDPERMNNSKSVYGIDFREEADILVEAFDEFRTTGQNSSRDVLFTKNTLIDIPDSGELLLVPNCKIEQLAIRVNKQFNDDPSYIIQQDIFRALHAKDVRGLVRHEVLYKLFAKNRAEDSRGARYANQKLGEQKIDALNFKDYADAISPTFTFVHKDGIYLSTKEIRSLAGNGMLVRGGLLSNYFEIWVVVSNEGQTDLARTRELGSFWIRVSLSTEDGNFLGLVSNPHSTLPIILDITAAGVGGLNHTETPGPFVSVQSGADIPFGKKFHLKAVFPAVSDYTAHYKLKYEGAYDTNRMAQFGVLKMGNTKRKSRLIIDLAYTCTLGDDWKVTCTE